MRENKGKHIEPGGWRSCRVDKRTSGGAFYLVNCARRRIRQLRCICVCQTVKRQRNGQIPKAQRLQRLSGEVWARERKCAHVRRGKSGRTAGPRGGSRIQSEREREGGGWKWRGKTENRLNKKRWEKEGSEKGWEKDEWMSRKRSGGAGSEQRGQKEKMEGGKEIDNGRIEKQRRSGGWQPRRKEGSQRWKTERKNWREEKGGREQGNRRKKNSRGINWKDRQRKEKNGRRKERSQISQGWAMGWDAGGGKDEWRVFAAGKGWKTETQRRKGRKEGIWKTPEG